MLVDCFDHNFVSVLELVVVSHTPFGQKISSIQPLVSTLQPISNSSLDSSLSLSVSLSLSL